MKMKLVYLFLLFLACNADFTFLTVGDWGETTTKQAHVAKQMGIVAEKLNATFVLSLGDNFYESGVKSVNDPQFTNTFQKIYTAKSLMIPWYVVLGNHDWDGNASAQVDYSQVDPTHRWVFPQFFYTETFVVDEDTAATLQIVYIDTVSLDYSSPDRLQWLQWIEKTLQASVSDWLIVAGHYPVFTGGEHGDTQELIDDVLPLFIQYNVDAYLCGHDHTLQHLQNNSINFYISGNGAKTQGTVKVTPITKFASTKNGFMTHTFYSPSFSLDMDDENRNGTTVVMEVNVYDDHGQNLYSYIQAPLPKSHHRSSSSPSSPLERGIDI